jgi:adenylyltransferase/sulfurtransferase
MTAAMPDAPALRLEEGRFARLEAIKWWKPERMAAARVLVVGAGAIGNEVIKNLALLGIGNIIVVDMDKIERSNLSRSVLFRQTNEGEYKSAVAARAARELYPEIKALSVVANVCAQMGLGYFRWADVVVGALDNREARVFVNRACAQVGRPWFDGGIDVLNGIVRGFAPPATACYECTMGQADWDLLAKRRSCALLAQQAFAEGGTPTTPTTASIIGAIQAQEVVKRLHDLDGLIGRGYLFEGLHHNSFTVNYPISPDCPWHGQPAPIEAVESATSDTPLRILWQRAHAALGGLDALDLSRELVEAFECPNCRAVWPVNKAIELVGPQDVPCPACKTESIPRLCHSLTEHSPQLELSARQAGLPAWDILWARHGEKMLGLELSGDAAGCLGA